MTTSPAENPASPSEHSASSERVDTALATGGELREARTKAGLSVQDVAKRLRLDPNVIDYLEAENYEHLPAPAFVRGYLRNYASLVGLAPGPLIDAFNRRGLPAPALRAGTTEDQAVTANRLPLRIATYGVLLCAAILTAVQLFGENSQPEKLNPAPIAEPERPSSDARSLVESASSAPEPIGAARPEEQPDVPQRRLTPVSTLPAGGSKLPVQTEEPSNSVAPESEAPHSNATTALVSPSLLEHEGASSALVSANPAMAADREATEALPPAAKEKMAASSEQAPQDHLSMRFAHDSWVEVYDHKGARLYYSLVKGSQALTLTGSAPFRVLLGYAKDVAIEYNGVPFDHRSYIHAQGLARFSLGKPSPAPASGGDASNAIAPAQQAARVLQRQTAYKQALLVTDNQMPYGQLDTILPTLIPREQ